MALAEQLHLPREVEKPQGAIAEMLADIIRAERKKIMDRAKATIPVGLKKKDPGLTNGELALETKRIIDVLFEGGFYTEQISDAVDREMLGHIDDLTGLLNPGKIKDLYEASIEGNRPGRASALLVIDIDYFKQVNDTYGHDVGDALLKNMGEIIKTHLRPYDIGIRKSGDEFILVLSDVSQIEVTSILARIAGDISAPIAGSITSPTISVGCVLIHAEDKSKPNFESAFKLADEAMYLSKAERGKLTIIGWADGDGESTEPQKHFAKFDLNVGLADGEKAFAYGEPKIGLVKDMLGSLEAVTTEVIGPNQRFIGEIGVGLGNDAEARLEAEGIPYLFDKLAKLLHEARLKNNGGRN